MHLELNAKPVAPKDSSRIWQSLALIGILALAAFLRLNRLDLIDFRFDQAYALQYAQDIVRGYLWGVQPHGSVAGHPALYLYLIALPYLFTRSFVAIAAFHALLDVLAVLLVWWIGARYFNRRVAFIAGLLMAVAPWAIQFSRNLWPVPIPLFSAVLMIGLIEVAQRKNPWGWALSGLGVALVAGTHLSGVYVLPCVAVALFIGRKSFKPVPALLGALPILLVAGGFLLHDAAHNFENLRAYTSAVGGGAQWSSAVFEHLAWLSGGTGIASLTGNSFGAWQAQTPAWSAWLDALQVAWLALSIVITIAVVMRDAMNERRGGPATAWRAALVVLMWLGSIVLLQVRSSRPVMLQYLPVMLPAPFLLMALGADEGVKLLQRIGVRSRAAAVAGFALAGVALALITLSHINTTLQFTTFVDNHDTRGGHSLPVRSALAARQWALDSLAKTNGNGDVILVIKDFPTPWNEQAAILRGVMADMPHRFLNSEGDGLVFRPDVTRYIFAPGAENMLATLQSLAKPGTLITQSIETQPNSGLRYVFAELQGPIETAGYVDAPQATWDSGVTLTAHRIDKHDDQLTVNMLLRVLQTPADGADYHWFNHVMRGDERIAQADGAGVHPSSWRAGDRVWQSFNVQLPSPVPAGPLQVRLGSYTWPEVKDVMVSAQNAAPSDAVTVLVP
jgi:4-amino-4-deoxy-L-arabinose transferase-like glycosyltransferase